MYGKVYKSGRHLQRFSGGGRDMKPTNNSEVLFGLFSMILIVMFLGFCVSVVFGIGG